MNPRSLFLLIPGLIMVLSALAGCAAVDQKIALNNAPVDRPASRETKEKIMLQSLKDDMQQIIPDIIAQIEKK